MKTISISLYNRPVYTKQVLDSLLKCEGIEEYHILIKIEPEVEDVIKLAQDFNHPHKKVVINNQKLGCSLNIFSCVNESFIQTDTNFHIHIEDDIVPSRDCLRYFEWASSYFQNSKEIGVITSYQRNRSIIPENIHEVKNLVSKHMWFTPWGWATWRDRWLNQIGPRLYSLITNRSIPYSSWDKHLHDILKINNLFQVFPLVSRTQNIGALNGAHCPGAEFHKERQWTHLFADDYSIYETDFIVTNMEITPWIKK